MSTVQEIAEAIGKLSPEEVAELRTIMDGGTTAPKVSYVDDETFEAAADKVFKHYEPLLKKLAE